MEPIIYCLKLLDQTGGRILRIPLGSFTPLDLDAGEQVKSTTFVFSVTNSLGISAALFSQAVLQLALQTSQLQAGVTDPERKRRLHHDCRTSQLAAAPSGNLTKLFFFFLKRDCVGFLFSDDAVFLGKVINRGLRRAQTIKKKTATIFPLPMPPRRIPPPDHLRRRAPARLA